MRQRKLTRWAPKITRTQPDDNSPTKVWKAETEIRNSGLNKLKKADRIWGKDWNLQGPNKEKVTLVGVRGTHGGSPWVLGPRTRLCTHRILKDYQAENRTKMPEVKQCGWSYMFCQDRVKSINTTLEIQLRHLKGLNPDHTLGQWFSKCDPKIPGQTSLVVQWLRIRLPMQGTRVRALVREDPTCRGATKPMHHNYWAHVPQILKTACLEPMLRNKRSHRNEKPTHCNEE